MSFDGDLYPTAGATSVMTTKGDIVRYDSQRERYGIGSANQVLQVNSGLPTWQTLSLASSVLTTQGDVLYYGASGLARLGQSTSGKVLTTAGAGANPTWEDGAASVLTTQGDVLYEGAAGLARLGQSTQYHTLSTEGSGANPQWRASATSTLSATGDILYASGANTLARLAAGSDADVLTLSSGVPSWAAPASGGGVETGTILPYGGDTSDSLSDYLFCDGAAVSRTTYSDLFAVTGTNFGTGDGSSTFNVPNMQSKFPRGTSSAQGGATGGADTVTLATSEIPSHTHTSAGSGSVGSHSHTLATVNSGGGNQFPAKWGHSPSTNTGNTTPSFSFSGSTSSATGGGGSHENKPAYLELLYIIKT